MRQQSITTRKKRFVEAIDHHALQQILCGSPLPSLRLPLEVVINAVRSCRSDRAAFFVPSTLWWMSPSTRMQLSLVAFAIAGTLDALAHADAVHIDFQSVDAGMNLAAPAEPAALPIDGAVSSAQHFGDEGSLRWQLLVGYADDFDSASQEQFGVSLSWFFIDNLSIDLQLDANYISQPGASAWGLGGSLMFRWHFISEESWSLYVDAGSGLLGTTQPTPSGGTDFNFTPQAGGGVSFELCEDIRLMIGLRWYHISNANTGDTNPGRNSLMGYAMISVPF
ncbi:MAG: acyloxyacyl hydrolase [Phycisphaerales bacterium]|nr:acyloxyacyl hydrolase [Phycisphaerales bacterium]